MRSFATVLLAGAFALTATYAAAQADPHHPAAGPGEAPTPTETAPAEIPGQQSQKPEFDTACPNSSPMMMMEMMAGGEAMPMMQMMQMMQTMQGTQLKMMQNMDQMQEQMLMMEQRLEGLTQPEDASP